MSYEDQAVSRLQQGIATPIAHLRPDLPNQTSRIVRGEVTITWPFNSVSKSIAFLVAEADVRLRRDRGQVRIQLNGPAAAAVASVGLGGGDEVVLSLDGVEWAEDGSTIGLPGSLLQWQLQYSRKLQLHVSPHGAVSPSSPFTRCR